MKKTNKRLHLNAQTLRTLTGEQLTHVAGGAPISRLGSGCISCDFCPTQWQTCSQFPCVTAYGGTCQTTC